MLLSLATSGPEMIDVGNKLATEVEAVVRGLLAARLATALDAATWMLCGVVLQAAMMHGHPAHSEVIAASVDLILHHMP